MEYITLLLFPTVVLADYFIDNADTSVVYSMPASHAGQGWQTYTTGSQPLPLSFSNSTGNYTIPIDPSHCYDRNYALGVCGTTDGCFVQIPFTGSGITLYVFNAGLSGTTASFSVDSGRAVTNTIQAPSPPNYQIANVSLFSIQGLPIQSHTLKMTLLDWNGSPTSMKFDYAYVNETFVTPSATSSISASTSQTSESSQTASPNRASSPSISVGGIVAATLGGVALCAIIAAGLLYLQRCMKPRPAVYTPESTFDLRPFPSEFGSAAPSTTDAHLWRGSVSVQELGGTPLETAPRVRSAMPGDVSATGAERRSPSIRSESGRSSFVHLAPFKHHLHGAATADLRGASAYVNSPSGSETARCTLTAEQMEVVDRLRRDNVPPDTVACVIDEFVSSNLVGQEALGDRKLVRAGSAASAARPPSYRSEG